MKKALVLLVFLTLSLSLASASTITCNISGTSWGAAVNGSTEVVCSEKSLTFFGQRSECRRGASGQIDLVSAGACGTPPGSGDVCISTPILV